MKKFLLPFIIPLLGWAESIDSSALQGLKEEMASVSQNAKSQRANLDYLPYIMTVFDGKELSETGAASLKDALALVAGVNISSDNLSLFNPVIRGSNPTSYGQSKLIVDGIEVNDLFFDGYTAYLAMPIDMIKRIEIVRGPGSYSDGHWGYAGSIIVTTYKKEPSPENRGTWFVSAGSNLSRTAGATYNVSYDNATFAADVYTVHDSLSLTYGDDALSNNIFGSVNAPLSRSGKAPSSTDATMASFLYTRPGWFLDGRLSSYRHGSGGGINYALASDDDHYNVNQWRLRGGVHYGIGDFSGTFEASAIEDSFISKALLGPANLLLGTVSYPNGFYGNHESFIRTYQVANTLSGNFEGGELTFGLNGSWSSALSEKTVTTDRTTGTGITDYSVTYPFVDPNGFIRDFKAYTNYERSLSQEWAGYVSLTYDKRNGLSGVVDPRIAAVYTINPTNTLKFSLSHAHRNPSWQEMFTLNNKARWGNPDLKPESVWAYEAQYIHRFEPEHTLSFNLFRLNNNDQIYLQYNASLARYEYVNGSESTINGLETEWRKRYDSTSFYAAYTHMWAHDGSGETLPYAPANLLRGFLTQEFTPQVYGSLSGRWQSATPRTSSDPRNDMKSIAVANATLGYRLPFFDGELQLIVKNIFDADDLYPSPARTYDDDYPSTGRTVLVTLRGAF